MLADLNGFNPYTICAGEELDKLVSKSLFPDSSNSLHYSTDDRAADKVKGRLQTLYGKTVVVGRTRLSERKYFARFESGPSTSTEVLAETYPLAVCRLALIIARNYSKACED